jgi:hypothetical protein
VPSEGVETSGFFLKFSEMIASQRTMTVRSVGQWKTRRRNGLDVGADQMLRVGAGWINQSLFPSGQDFLALELPKVVLEQKNDRQHQERGENEHG